MVTFPTSHRVEIYLDMVCAKVKRHLAKRKAVFVTNLAQRYKVRIYDIRISSEHQFLQVRSCSCWSSVWPTEKLVNEYGESLYESPARYEYDEDASEEALENFVTQIGLIPWCTVKEAF